VNDRKLPWWRSAIYAFVTILFFVVGVQVAGFCTTSLLFLAILILVEMDRTAQQ